MRSLVCLDLAPQVLYLRESNIHHGNSLRVTDGEGAMAALDVMLTQQEREAIAALVPGS